MTTALASGLETSGFVEFAGRPQADIPFRRMPLDLITGLVVRGFGSHRHRWEPGVVRVMTSATERWDVDERFASMAGSANWR